VAPLVLSLIEFLQLEQLHDLGLHTDVLTARNPLSTAPT
jgi:hypothetical protein